jgi:hypothetical protein
VENNGMGFESKGYGVKSFERIEELKGKNMIFLDL